MNNTNIRSGRLGLFYNNPVITVGTFIIVKNGRTVASISFNRDEITQVLKGSYSDELVIRYARAWLRSRAEKHCLNVNHPLYSAHSYIVAS